MLTALAVLGRLHQRGVPFAENFGGGRITAGADVEQRGGIRLAHGSLQICRVICRLVRWQVRQL